VTPRVAVSLVFFLHGLATGTWISRIPAVQENLALGEAALGLALLGGGLGSLMAMLPAGALIARHGSRSVLLWTSLPTCAALALIAAARSGPTLFAALVLWGATGSALDVAMNAQGSAIEGRLGRPIMSSLHGLWSLGNMAGAAAGALVAGLSAPVQLHLPVAAAALLVMLLLVGRRLVVGDEGQHAGAVFARPRGALLALAAIAFCAVTAEGAMFDWSGVYLRRVLAAPEATAAAAASFFSAAMATGRLGGDWLTARLRPAALARACAALAALGIAAIMLAPVPGVVFGGLVAVGFGLSVLVPLAFGAAGRSPDMPAGAAIAAVATMGYLGFLVGPPTIGLAAEQVTLRGAFVLLLLLLGLIALLAPATGDRPAARGRPGLVPASQPSPAQSSLRGRSRD
jgi:MFS family permease